MTPERWAQVKKVLGIALEKPDAERSEFLDQACDSDASLREEIERLLTASDSRSFESPLAAPPELAPGRMVGHYRVESRLGQGGMGAVYKAWDEQLQRPVALKVLSTRQFDDASHRQRFLREARAASALNHPNVVTVYEVGSEGGVDFIAMEYIAGQSLERLIPAKGLPLKQALDYSITIAGALAKAHAAGIVHRDLKPANVVVTHDGMVKLLDFGLARRLRLSGAATTTLTREGEIAGTPAYMSPEQAEGKPADERSDIFSFGVLLYEMLSGRRAFTGDSTIAILGAVLTAEPPPLRGLPAELDKLVSRCLRKDPAERLQDMDDVRILLEDIRRDASKAPAAPERPRRLVRPAALALVLVCACVALWFVAWPGKPRPAEMEVVPLTTYPGMEIQPSFSPDGTQVAFAWDGENQDNYDIYVTVVGSSSAPLRLTSHAAADLYPSWSPDGRRIAFVRQDGLYLISALGGPEHKVVDLQLSPRLAANTHTLAWSPDSKWLAVSEGSWQGPWAISLISVEREDRRRLFSSFTVPRVPAFSPDGRYLAYAACSGLAGHCDVHLLELGPDLSPRGPARPLTRQRLYIDGLAWTADSRGIVYAAAPCPPGPSRLWRVGVSGAKPPERMDVAGLGTQFPAISRTGSRLAYVRASRDWDIWKFQIGSAAPVRLLFSSLDETSPAFSCDGNKVAFASNRSEGCPEIWVSDRDGSNVLKLTDEQGVYQGSPRWSPDGRWIAFDRVGQDGHTDIHVMRSDGTQPRRFTPFPSDESAPSWSRDGRWIYFRSNRSGTNEIWKMSFQAGQAVHVTGAGGYVALESWDGKTLYYLKTGANSGGPLFASSLAGGPERLILPDTIGFRAFCPARDGIYYIQMRENRGAPHKLKFYNLASGRTQVLTTIGGDLSQGLAVSPDQKTVLFSAGQKVSADLMLIENFH